MKKIILPLLIVGVMGFSACYRSDAPGPGDMFGPSSSAYILTLTAHPSVVQAVDPLRNPANSEVTLKARLSSYNKGPMARRTIYFYIYDIRASFTPPDSKWQCSYRGGAGLLNGNQIKSVSATTDANGIATAKYLPPTTGDLRVVCDTGEKDSAGNPIVKSYRIGEVTVLIKAAWRGGSLSDVEAVTPVKVIR